MANERLSSLDVVRGATIAAMVMVNNQTGPGAYYQLRHAAWDGWTFTDMVFPFFLWIVGVSLVFSTAKRVSRGDAPASLATHAFRRAVLIFAIGLFLNGFPSYDLASLRIPGVLQRIAVCYLIAAILFLYTSTRAQILTILGVCAAYWALMHSGGYERGTNFAATVDWALLPGHLYSNTKTWDPEGFVSTLPSIATCLFGVLTGQFLRTANAAEKTSWLYFSGSALLFAGYALSPLQPINKSLWTVPYALIMAGLAAIIFASTYWLIDVRGHSGSWTRPWTIFGLNAMAVYIFHGLLGRLFSIAGLRQPLYDAFEPALGPANASLLYSLVHVAASFAFAWLLWTRRWVLKL